MATTQLEKRRREDWWWWRLLGKKNDFFLKDDEWKKRINLCDHNEIKQNYSNQDFWKKYVKQNEQNLVIIIITIKKTCYWCVENIW